MGTTQSNIDGTIGSMPRCGTCGSERIVKDAWACWNPDSGLWEIEMVFDHAHCHHCEGDTTLVWAKAEHPPHLRIRELNDRFRRDGRGNGSVFVTSGVQERGADFLLAAVTAVRRFSDFSEDNDPWGEHDFGAVDIDGEKIFFKIDYYADSDMSVGSENPANEGATHRVLTIMLASEY